MVFEEATTNLIIFVWKTISMNGVYENVFNAEEIMILFHNTQSHVYCINTFINV